MRISQPWRFINCFLVGFITGLRGLGVFGAFVLTPYDDEPESSGTAVILGYMLGGGLFIGLMMLIFSWMVNYAP